MQLPVECRGRIATHRIGVYVQSYVVYIARCLVRLGMNFHACESDTTEETAKRC